MNDPKASERSRFLNLMFSFASTETGERFPPWIEGGFMAVNGRVFHRVRPTHANSGVKWLLYDNFMYNLPPHRDHRLARDIPSEWIIAFQLALMDNNPFAQELMLLGRLAPHQAPLVNVVVSDPGTGSEIAAIMSYANTSHSQIQPRSIVIVKNDAREHYIPTVSRLWEPLAYPLFFPSGTLGWGVVGRQSDIAPTEGDAEAIAPDGAISSAQMWHYRMRLLHEPRFEIFGRLTNEYIVDMFSRSLECRLHYIRHNQHTVAHEDAELMGLPTVENTANIYLPSSFLGSNRWASEQIADSLAIAAQLGAPTFFVTMTCNKDWPEIQEKLRRGQSCSDIPIVVMRVFRRKLALLEKALKTMFPHARPLLYIIRSVEFQKRGLPHAHILIKFSADCSTPEAIDAVISAEMPEDEADARLVRKFMVHNHTANYCQRENRQTKEKYCRFSYPHALQDKTTIDHQGRVHYRRRKPGDEYVVPHCLALLRAFECHINFEAASSSQLFQYIFKYIHKGKLSC